MLDTETPPHGIERAVEGLCIRQYWGVLGVLYGLKAFGTEVFATNSLHHGLVKIRKKL